MKAKNLANNTIVFIYGIIIVLVNFFAYIKLSN